jgi:hypothetical protein
MITLELVDHDLQVQLQQASATTQLAFQKAMRDITAYAHRILAQNMGDGGFIGVRTGMMRRAIKEEVTVDASGMTGRVYLDPAMGRYFDIQETGGTIMPTNAQFLTIPLAAMLTGSGVARGTARDVFATPQAFGFQSTFIAHGVIFGVETGGAKALGTVVPLFALKASVTIPGTHYLQQTLDQILGWIQQRLEDATGEVVRIVDGAATP